MLKKKMNFKRNERLISDEDDENLNEFEMVNLDVVEVEVSNEDNSADRIDDSQSTEIAYTCCDIKDKLIEFEEEKAMKQSAFSMDLFTSNILRSNTLKALIFCLAVCCDIFLIYFICEYVMSHTPNPMLLLKITISGACYLTLCGVYQAFSYPEHRFSVQQIQHILDELIASYPQITVAVNGCNFWAKHGETGKYHKMFTHSISKTYGYDECHDKSDDFNQMLAVLAENKRTWNIMELDIALNISLGDDFTNSHYLAMREEFIATHCKATTQSYVSSAEYFVDGAPVTNQIITGYSIGEVQRIWVINEENLKWTQWFLQDATYWIFSVILLSHWLYVLVAYLLVSKRDTFNISKQIFVEQGAHDDLK